METRHFGSTLCKQKVKTYILSTLAALNVKWVPRFTKIFIHSFIHSCETLEKSNCKLNSFLKKGKKVL